MIRDRQVSPCELVEAHLRQIERVNPQLNAFMEVYADEARDYAVRLAEELAETGPRGPLHGVPVTVKDSFDVEGKVTACGSRLRVNERAARDATAVRRLRSAGAIVLGKTSCPEFLMNWETDNHLAGRTNNPWNLARTSGGSSGGEAAAIASFCSAGGIGSDGGGSIREPAGFCGIAGLKPTPGRCSAAGHWPEICHPGGLLGVGGPMARNAADVRALFEVLSGHDPLDPFSVPFGPRPLAAANPAFAVMEHYQDVPVLPEVRDAVRCAARLLSEARCEEREFDHGLLQGAHELWWFLFGRCNAAAILAMTTGREAETHWSGMEIADKFREEAPPSGPEVLSVLYRRDRMRGPLLEFLQRVPVVVAPICAVTAFEHRQRKYAVEGRELIWLEAMTPLTFVNLFGLPSVAVPMALSPDGLPIGVQLIGAPYTEELLLDLAVRLESARGLLSSPPIS